MGGRDSFATIWRRLGKAQKESRLSSVTFDAGGLIALERNDRRVIALLTRASERGMAITIPATALAQVMRNPSRQARLSSPASAFANELLPICCTLIRCRALLRDANGGVLKKEKRDHGVSAHKASSEKTLLPVGRRYPCPL